MSESMIRKRAMAQHLSRAEPPSKSHFRVCNVRFPLEIRFKMVCNAEVETSFISGKELNFFEVQEDTRWVFGFSIRKSIVLV